MSGFLIYIGPGLGLATIITVLLIVGIVLFSFGYIVWLKMKRLFRKRGPK